MGVVGGGSWGTTIASMLAERFDTLLWAREAEVADSVSQQHENPFFLPGVRLTSSLRASTSVEEVLDQREVVMVVVPAQHVRDVAVTMSPVLRPDAAVLSLTKGIERVTLLRPTEVLTEVLARHDPTLIGVMSGPNLAREIAVGHPAATVVAIPDQEWGRRLQSFMMSDRFRAYTSVDVVGCEIGGAVKNVMAIAAGMADGLGYGWNTRAALDHPRPGRAHPARGQARGRPAHLPGPGRQR